MSRNEEQDEVQLLVRDCVFVMCVRVCLKDGENEKRVTFLGVVSIMCGEGRFCMRKNGDGHICACMAYD